MSDKADPEPVLAPLLRKLGRWGQLTSHHLEALLNLPFINRSIDAGHYIVREGDEPRRSCLLLSGLAFRQKLSGHGRRQILSIHMNGDLVDLQNSLLGRADHNVQMLTSGRIALIPVEAIRSLAFNFPAIGMALWYETLVDSAMFQEWILNVGQRDARTRIAHHLCEFAVRLEVAGVDGSEGYILPMTQEQIADATGLTSVHVNRMLKQLAEDGFVSMTHRAVRISDWRRLVEVADFDASYLHLQAQQPSLSECPV